MSAAALILAPGYLRVLTSALEGLQQRLDEEHPEPRLLLLAPDGILHGAGDYMHAEKDVEDAALSGLAAALSTKLATIGRQATGGRREWTQRRATQWRTFSPALRQWAALSP